MLYLLTELEFNTRLMIIIVFILIFIYECINGFHDTANAIVAVIYTKSLQEKHAVILSSIFNFFGVMTGGLSVAYTIIHLFPNDLFVTFNSIYNLTMIFSILLSGILWNLSTWYFGLPASSSHTLIGVIIGSCLTNSLIKDISISKALNISKLIEIFFSLIISPILGLVFSGIITFFIRKFVKTNKKNKCYYSDISRNEINNNQQPPFWTRIILILSSICLSFSHGTNDGQKGIGLIMLILMGFCPIKFSINVDANSYSIKQTKYAINALKKYYVNYKTYYEDKNNNFLCFNKKQKRKTFIKPYFYNKKEHRYNIKKSNKMIKKKLYSKILCSLKYIDHITMLLENINDYNKLCFKDRFYVRSAFIYITNTIDEILKTHKISIYEKCFLKNLKKDILYNIEYAPFWVTFSVALSLSIGTVIGWRRIAVTIGEKIGKKSINYVQALSAQITAAISIYLASYTGMPVSTTHVVSSAFTGTILVDGEHIQKNTIKSILITWILTLPISIILSFSVFWTAIKFLKY